MKTKEQERKALEQIKKILADFGPDSYIGMAFDGCVEDAEENIENDWGCSMRQRYKEAFIRAEDLTQINKDQAEEIEALRAALAREEKKALPNSTLDTLLVIVNNRIVDMKDKARTQAENIVLLADDPTQANFQDAVKLHREYLRIIEADSKLSETLRNARNAK